MFVVLVLMFDCTVFFYIVLHNKWYSFKLK